MTKGRLGKNWNNDLSNYDDGNIIKGLFLGLGISIPIWLIIFFVISIL